ncbi:MAG TPA: 23S rRNA (adenine(2030)-N(6))-methyltransferase RlmJ [Candidatus Sulfotelmatobacter sp.]|nr:23S rRNA (adenine(2030)-N(6))-methyltransferase RlmJ [Candidatus Sulfotelmatobacter sp.]
MNYRHAFHAGGIADVFKHAVLVLLIEQLARKATPFCYIDTHAGCGQYDLTAEAAAKTGEFRAGIGRLLDGAPPPALARYAALVRAAQPTLDALTVYPGSPALAQALLRPQDGIVLCELHPDDAAALRRRFRDDARVHVHARDGYEALGAFVPPRERRGLVLIDPPYEERDELVHVVAALRGAHRRWPTGQYALWYPLKARGALDRFHGALVDSGLRKLMAVEFVAAPDETAPDVLRGSGLILVNPPWRLEDALAPLLDALGPALGQPNAVRRLDWLVPE